MAARINLVGQRFGQLTVLEQYPLRKVLVKCDCGNTKIVNSSNMRSGGVLSCGCKKTGRKPENIPDGTKFGRWTVIGESERKSGTARRMLVQYDCGSKPKFVELSSLKCGDSTSCGCFRAEVLNDYYASRFPPDEEFVGLTSGFLTFDSHIEKSPIGIKQIRCICYCGTKIEIYAKDFLDGHTKSCGCYKKIVATDIIQSWNKRK